MKPIMATVTAPAPKKGPRRARKGIMVRTIKVDFDQSGDLSKLISRHMDQQRWAYNMAVRKVLGDPRITKFDLDGMLTKWRNANTWLVRDDDAQAVGLRQACDSRVQRTGLRQVLDAVKRFMESNATKRYNKIMWKNLARHDREKEGIPDIGTAANLPPNKWSNKRNRWSHKGDLLRRKDGRQALCVFRVPCPRAAACCIFPA